MLDGNTLVLVALTTLVPTQAPHPTPTAAPVVVSAPATAPIATAVVVPPAHYHRYQAKVTGTPICDAPACESCHGGWTWQEKFKKLVGFFCYQSVHKMPCCLPEPEPYRPPLVAWFPPCVGGVCHEMPPACPPNKCPTCLHRGFKLWGSPLPACPTCGAKH